MKKFVTILCFLFIFGTVVSVKMVNAQQVIPEDRKIDWSYAGVPGGIPERETICQTLGVAGQLPGYAQSVSAAHYCQFLCLRQLSN